MNKSMKKLQSEKKSPGGQIENAGGGLPSPVAKRARAGFTMVELLVVIAVLGILASLIFSMIGSIRRSGEGAKAVANMRAIGTAIGIYVSENNGFLPGPLWPGQVPQLDPNRDGRLVRLLAPYLGIDMPAQPQVIGLFVPPAFRRVMGEGALETSRTYVVNMDVADGSGSLNPWGSLVANAESNPVRLASLPAATWGFSDADRQHPRVAMAGWAANTPPTPVHGRRLAWFFNGSVAQLGVEEM